MSEYTVVAIFGCGGMGFLTALGLTIKIWLEGRR